MKRNVLKVATIAIFSCSGSRTDQLGCLSDGLGSQIKREAANEDFSQRSIGRGWHRARRAFYESGRLARHAWPYGRVCLGDKYVIESRADAGGG